MNRCLARRAVALSLVALLFALAALLGGCSRRPRAGALGGATADTLRNGLPRSIVPKLSAWLRVWRYASPDFAADSMARAGSAHFEFDYAWAGAGHSFDSVRDRAGIEVLSPDSTHALDFDMYLDFNRDEDGSIQILREPDSAPVLADFKADSLWRISFCGTLCFYDGAYWLDAEGFVLTGATQTDAYADGPWCPFLEIYDLRSRALGRWTGPTVERSKFGRYQSASDSAIAARLEGAGFGKLPGSAAGSRVGLSDPGAHP